MAVFYSVFKVFLPIKVLKSGEMRATMSNTENKKEAHLL